MFFVKAFLRILPFLTAFALMGGAAFAADPISLEFQNKNGNYTAEGSFRVTADWTVAWWVLTDYDHLHDFVGSLKRSHLQEYWGRNHFLVEQEFEGGFLFVTKMIRLRLDVREIRCATIYFEDVGHEDFEFYKG